MKRTLLAALIATVVTSASGCCLIDRLFQCRPCCGSPAPYGCTDGCGGGGCGDGGCDSCGGGYPAGPEIIDSGPPVGQTTYPYYTTRGPRDYLTRSPRDIGP